MPRIARLAMGMGIAALMSGCRSDHPPVTAGAARIPVQVVAVTDTVLHQPVIVSGLLAAKEEVPLGFKIGGVVARVLVEEGQRVSAGQLLATLELPEIAGAVARAEAAQKLAAQNLDRARRLYQDSVVTQATLEQAETADAVARADLGVARFNQQYAVIRAPVAGTVQRRLAEPGQQIAAGSAVLMLASAVRGQVVRLGLPDRDAARVRVGDPAEVLFDLQPDFRVRGRVSQIGAAATPGSGTWPVEVSLDQTVNAGEGGLASGLIGSVVITPRRPERVRLIPLAALLEGDGDTALVYTVGGPDQDRAGVDSEARGRPVRIAFLTGDRAAIADGLDSVRQVITEGAAYLRDGTPVSVRGTTAEPAGGAR